MQRWLSCTLTVVPHCTHLPRLHDEPLLKLNTEDICPLLASDKLSSSFSTIFLSYYFKDYPFISQDYLVYVLYYYCSRLNFVCFLFLFLFFVLKKHAIAMAQPNSLLILR